MKKLAIIIILLSSCKPHCYTIHKNRVKQLEIQYEHSRAAKDDPNRAYRNWHNRPKNDTFLFIFNLE